MVVPAFAAAARKYLLLNTLPPLRSLPRVFYNGRSACRAMIRGRRRERAKASAAIREVESCRIVLPIDMKNPKVAPDPSIYCPRVLITPFGPAPNLMMLTEPKINPIITPTVLPIIKPILNLSNVDGPPRLLPTGTGILSRTRRD